MTREEAIQALKDLRDIRLQGVEWKEPLDMAIEALQTEVVLCKDCIYGEIEGHTTKFMVCEFHDDIATDPCNHCSWGKRREP